MKILFFILCLALTSHHTPPAIFIVDVKRIAMASIPELVNKYSAEHNVRPDIVAAIIVQESGGNPLAFRFEPKFYERRLAFRSREGLSGHVPPPPPEGVTLISEKIMRATSWGLMQIMGETARSALGFKSNHIISLVDPEINIALGVKYLAGHLAKFSNLPEKERYTKALTLYNGSSDYPPLIFDHIKHSRHLKFMRA